MTVKPRKNRFIRFEFFPGQTDRQTDRQTCVFLATLHLFQSHTFRNRGKTNVLCTRDTQDGHKNNNNKNNIVNNLKSVNLRGKRFFWSRC